MTAVLGLLLILAGVSHGIETSCDARQNGAECYGALGGTVYLQLIDNPTGLQLTLTLNDSKILRYKSNWSIILDNSVHFIINNGTLGISNTGKTYSGIYKLEAFDEMTGHLMWINTFQLSIEAPVSSPQLSSECLSLGEMRVSCSSGGDSLQYTWTLDGHTLDDSTVSSGEGRSSVTLKRGTSGLLSCTVNNHVSQDTKNIDISTCNGIETSCDARPNGAECYGALGGTVYLQLIDNTTGLDLDLTLNDSKMKILKHRSNKLSITDNSVHFIINNGTLRISNTGKKYSSFYKVEAFNEITGHSMWTNTFQLAIEAPVSSPQLSSECLSLGEMRVSCSSGGDSLQYTWTLDGHTLDDSTVSSGEGRSSVTLKRGTSGQLSCTVNNHVSQDTKNIDISTCNGLKYINCTLSNGTDVSDWVKPTGENLCTKTTTAAPSTQTTDEEEEVTYANVKRT